MLLDLVFIAACAAIMWHWIQEDFLDDELDSGDRRALIPFASILGFILCATAFVVWSLVGMFTSSLVPHEATGYHTGPFPLVFSQDAKSWPRYCVAVGEEGAIYARATDEFQLHSFPKEDARISVELGRKDCSETVFVETGVRFTPQYTWAWLLTPEMLLPKHNQYVFHVPPGMVKHMDNAR